MTDDLIKGSMNGNTNLKSGSDAVSGVYRGRVEYNQDPKMAGRVKVRIPMFHGMKSDGISTKDLPWATVSYSSAGYGYGTYIVPEVGEFVLVIFEDLDVDKPVVIGSVFGSGSKKSKKYGYGGNDTSWKSTKGESEIPEESKRVLPDMKVVYKSPTGSKILVDEKDGSEGILLEDPTGQHLTLSSKLKHKKKKGPKGIRNSNQTRIELLDKDRQGIVIEDEKGKKEVVISSVDGWEISISPSDSGCIINSPKAKVHIDISGNISIEGNNIDVKSSGTTRITSNGSISVSSSSSIGIMGDGVTIGAPVTLIED